ncbi:DNA polymerase IV [Flaviflagellibacter deserti]|uniref:DNA polymerase IV n=1 Tax=Flaviflagellibacter deserti TaxID=2267266 RepID=A0ABV9Z3C6_9HYPH
MAAAPGFCRDCLTEAGDGPRCTACGSPRLARHAEINQLTVSHIDCDAFFATIEKRDNPDIRDKPVIVGGAKRGVVSTACYIARINGVHSAMPMFKALKLCPEAVVVKPNHAKYSAVGREVRALMRELTPLVEPVSIDEAFLDLAGTERVHGMPPARVLARFARRVEEELGITVSVGLAPNKFLAKIASDLEKPRGFAIIGRADARDFLHDKPITIIPGIGPAARIRMEKKGIRTVGDVRRFTPREIGELYGAYGLSLWNLAHGEDNRRVKPERETKSVSAETTFNEDISDREQLEAILWTLSERVATRLKASEFAGSRITLKLKSPDFKSRTRTRTLDSPTRLAGRIFETGRELLKNEARGERFRLIGIGVEELCPIAEADPPSLLDPNLKRRIAAEAAVDKLKGKFGADAVKRGIVFKR